MLSASFRRSWKRVREGRAAKDLLHLAKSSRLVKIVRRKVPHHARRRSTQAGPRTSRSSSSFIVLQHLLKPSASHLESLEAEWVSIPSCHIHIATNRPSKNRKAKLSSLPSLRKQCSTRINHAAPLENSC